MAERAEEAYSLGLRDGRRIDIIPTLGTWKRVRKAVASQDSPDEAETNVLLLYHSLPQSERDEMTVEQFEEQVPLSEVTGAIEYVDAAVKGDGSARPQKRARTKARKSTGSPSGPLDASASASKGTNSGASRSASSTP